MPSAPTTMFALHALVWFLSLASGNALFEDFDGPLRFEDRPDRADQVCVDVIGMKSATPGGKVNRNGIGTWLHLTPDGGERASKPVVGGSSWNAERRPCGSPFEMGGAEKGNLEVAWPGSGGQVWNALHGVRAGEEIVFPEIPCCWKSERFAAMEEFDACLDPALRDLRDAGAIGNDLRNRLRDGMRNAWRAHRSRDRPSGENDSPEEVFLSWAEAAMQRTQQLPPGGVKAKAETTTTTPRARRRRGERPF